LRKLVKNIFTGEEAASLAVGRHALSHPLIERVIDLMKGAAIIPSAYARVEDNTAGHNWHYDTGDMNHMPWCQYSASVLLTPPDQFEGGLFQFRHPFEEYKHYLDALIYSSNEEHRVTPHRGERKVLLIFLGSENGKRSRNYKQRSKHDRRHKHNFPRRGHEKR
tara:strand:- start:5509 stop:6000 length:492 start_codon:yes stop_codon:yes gene_type:complete